MPKIVHIFTFLSYSIFLFISHDLTSVKTDKVLLHDIFFTFHNFFELCFGSANKLENCYSLAIFGIFCFASLRAAKTSSRVSFCNLINFDFF